MSVTITRVNKAIRHSLTVESTQSNPFMRRTFHQLFSEETFVGVLLYRASLESRNNVPYCTPPLPVSVYPIPSTLPPALDLHPNRCGRAAVSQQETLMRCTTELALTTIPPSVLFPFASLSTSPHCAQLLTYRAGDPHSTHCCTHVHLQTGGREYWEDKEIGMRGRNNNCNNCQLLLTK